MYCPSCGEEIENSVRFCPSCGVEISSITNSTETRTQAPRQPNVSGFDYDIAMSIEDALSRRSTGRWIVDVGLLLVTAGFWIGFLAVELLTHHRNLNKGKTKPWEEGDETEFNIM